MNLMFGVKMGCNIFRNETAELNDESAILVSFP